MKKSIIKLMPIGGQAENGKSMYCLEIDDNWFIIDAGYRFPEVDKLGVDVIIPNFDYLKDNDMIDELKEVLKKEGIYFIDVFKKVIRQKNTASDKAIMFGTLNDDAFTNFINGLNNNKILVVANSKLSYDLCNRILTRNNLKDKCVFLDKPHTIFNYWDFNKMVDDWKKVFELTK